MILTTLTSLVQLLMPGIEPVFGLFFLYSRPSAPSSASNCSAPHSSASPKSFSCYCCFPKSPTSIASLRHSTCARPFLPTLMPIMFGRLSALCDTVNVSSRHVTCLPFCFLLLQPLSQVPLPSLPHCQDSLTLDMARAAVHRNPQVARSHVPPNFVLAPFKIGCRGHVSFHALFS